MISLLDISLGNGLLPLSMSLSSSLSLKFLSLSLKSSFRFDEFFNIFNVVTCLQKCSL